MGFSSTSYSIVHEPSYAPLPRADQGNTAIGIVFHPTRVGSLTAQLRLVTEDPVTTTHIPLSGTGVTARGTMHNGLFTGLGPGQSTIGAGGNYQTLQAACADISSKYLTGGDWTFLILNDLTEQNPASLGVHHTNGHTITFRPAPGTQPTITFPTAGRLYIGAPAITTAPSTRSSTQLIVIDGSTTVGRTDRSLTFRNTGAAGAGALIHVLGDCDYITLKNLNVQCFPSRSDNYYREAVRFDGEINPYNTANNDPTLAGDFSDLSRIENCDIQVSSLGPGHGIFYSVVFPPYRSFTRFPLPGSAGLLVHNNTIKSNAGGIYLFPMEQVTITSNTVHIFSDYDSSYPESTPTPVIGVSGPPQATRSGTFVIAGNMIRLLSGETTHSLSGIYFRGNSPAGTMVDVYNNMVSGLTAAAPGGPSNGRFAILEDSTEPTTATVIHNSIEMTGRNLSTTATRTAAIGNRYSRSNGIMKVRNNIIRLEVPGAGAYSFNPGSGVVVADHNNVFTTSGSVVGYYRGIYYNTLDDWRAGTGNDSSTIQLDPFLPASDGLGTWTAAAGAGGADLHFSAFPGDTYMVSNEAGVPTDIDGDLRSGPATLIGADEVGAPQASIPAWGLY